MKNFDCDIVFKQNCPGLGDSLQFSTLPERYSSCNKKFYLHSSNIVNNDGIEKLVWRSNPFVQRKKSNSAINCTYHNLTPRLSKKHNVRNFVEWAEFCNGFTVENSKPKVYCKTEKIDEVEGVSVLDLGSITCFRRNFYDQRLLIEAIKRVVDTKKTLLVDSQFSKSPIISYFNFMNTVKIKNIFHYTNVIKSCQRFYCLYSGGASLASAVREDGCFVFFPEIDRKKEISGGSHLFPNNTYYLSDKTTLNGMKEWRFNA